MPTTSVWVRAATLAALATQAAAQQCYYPNGAKAPDTEKPCSSGKGPSACCPDSWQCLDNGLCHYPPTNLFGRYSCTDKNWKGDGCASNLCTYGMAAPGGESITQCSNHDNQWCCNADAQHVNCCQESPSPRPFFALKDGTAYATIGGQIAMNAPDLADITGLASGGNSAPQTSAPASSNKPSSAGANSPSSAGSSAQTAKDNSVSTTATPFMSVSASVSSGPAGVVTVPITFYVTPSSTATSAAAGSNTSSGSNSNLGVIIGCAVGIPLALALFGIIFWMLRKRRQQKANPYNDVTETDGDNGGLIGGAAGKLSKKDTFHNSAPTTAEIDGNPVGAGRPISTVKGHAELASGNGFQPGQGTPYGPDAVGIGGGNGSAQPDRNTWGSVPPQYSPAHNQTAFNQYEGASELDGTSVMPAIKESTEGAQQYQPYRPPQPAAEMSTVTTPPEDLEKQVQR